MSASASWAAAGPGGDKQAEGERRERLQAGKGGLGQRTQTAGNWYQLPARWAGAKSSEDQGSGERAAGEGMSRAQRMRIILLEPVCLLIFPVIFNLSNCNSTYLMYSITSHQNSQMNWTLLYVRRKRLWESHLPKRKLIYWKGERQAKRWSGSWRRTSKPWPIERWKKKPSWKGLICLFFFFCHPHS